MRAFYARPRPIRGAGDDFVTGAARRLRWRRSRSRCMSFRPRALSFAVASLASLAAGCGPLQYAPLWTDAGAPYDATTDVDVAAFELLGAPLDLLAHRDRLRPERGVAQRRSVGAARARARRSARRLESTRRAHARPRPTSPSGRSPAWSQAGATPTRSAVGGDGAAIARVYVGSAITARPPGADVHVRRDGRQPHRAARSDPAGLDRRPGALLRTWRPRCAR